MDIPPSPNPLLNSRYQLLERLGKGGMGEVWKVRDVKLDRIVAIKKILNTQASEKGRKRFDREARALAALQHPNIVQVHDYDLGNDDQPFMVMEFLAGGSLSKRLKNQPQPAKIAAYLLYKLALVVQAAHDKGIIHRDLKPDNVLIVEDENTPLHRCTLKISDFGLARFLESADKLTTTGAMLGTLPYMAPEQAEGATKTIGPSADIYALGAILYEVLTGRPPFTAPTPLALFQQLCNDPPEPIRSLQPNTPEALDDICLKCLKKTPTERFSTAKELASALDELLQKKLASKTSKWAIITGYKVLLILREHTGPVTSVAFSPDSKRILTASRTGVNKEGKVCRGEAMLWDADRGNKILSLQLHTSDSVESVCFSPTGVHILTGCGDLFSPHEAGEAKLWDSETGTKILTLSGHFGNVCSAAFSPDGKRILTGSEDGTAKLWDAQKGTKLLTVNVQTLTVSSVCFSPDGKRILTGSWDSTAKVWDAYKGTQLLTLKGHTAPVPSAAFSPNGQHILTGSYDGTAKVWDADKGTELLTLQGHTSWVRSVSWSPDGKRILTGSGDNTAKVWDAEKGQEILTLKGHTSAVYSVSWSPDGKRILTGSVDNTAILWEAVYDD